MSDWTPEEVAELNQEMGDACMDMLRDELVSRGIVDANVPPMFYPEAITAVAMERDALRARIEGAPRKTISADLDDAIGRYCGSRFAPSVIGKRVALVVLEDGK